ALLAHQLLLLVPRVVPLLQPAELGQCRGRSLVEQQGHGLRLLGLGDQHGVAAQHHRLVLQLVAVDPGENTGQARVGHAVGDPVQQVEVAGPAQPLVLDLPPPSRCPAEPQLLGPAPALCSVAATARAVPVSCRAESSPVCSSEVCGHASLSIRGSCFAKTCLPPALGRGTCSEPLAGGSAGRCLLQVGWSKQGHPHTIHPHRAGGAGAGTQTLLIMMPTELFAESCWALPS
uniref:Uncharacterized protein n=1 Tax=Zonotrichia albicollis TaxID=44394 RepID=A0A8D2N259_ZONAL